VLQAIAFRKTGKYIRFQNALKEAVSIDEQVIVHTSLSLKNGCAISFDKMSEDLFAWSKKIIEGK
jgi:hypothetical protein